jgi:hypothetical protein
MRIKDLVNGDCVLVRWFDEVWVAVYRAGKGAPFFVVFNHKTSDLVMVPLDAEGSASQVDGAFEVLAFFDPAFALVGKRR